MGYGEGSSVTKSGQKVKFLYLILKDEFFKVSYRKNGSAATPKFGFIIIFFFF